MVHLFTVVERFQIEGRGCVLAPGLSFDAGHPVVKRAARIRLRTPSGGELDTYIESIEHIRYRVRPEKITYPIMLPGGLSKDDVPIGTEVFLLEEKFETIKP